MPTLRDDDSFRAHPEAVVATISWRRASQRAIGESGGLTTRTLRELFVDADSSAIS